MNVHTSIPVSAISVVFSLKQCLVRESFSSILPCTTTIDKHLQLRICPNNMFGVHSDRDGEIPEHIEENNDYVNELSSLKEAEIKQYGNAANC